MAAARPVVRGTACDGGVGSTGGLRLSPAVRVF